jgi:hypothetical protein
LCDTGQKLHLGRTAQWRGERVNLEKKRFTGKLFSHHKKDPMNLTEIFCPNINCPKRGWCNAGNISVYTQAEQRCYFNVCQKSFGVKKTTFFFTRILASK